MLLGPLDFARSSCIAPRKGTEQFNAMFGKSEYDAAIAAVRRDEKVIRQISQAVPWMSLCRLAEMLSDPESRWWDWEGMGIAPHSGGGIYRVGCIYKSEILRFHWGFQITSSGKHRVSVSLSPSGEVTDLNTGTEESLYSFGGDYTPAERVERVAERLREAGLKVAKNATAAAKGEIKKLQQLERLLKTGPERPGTKVRKALQCFPRDLVMAVASRLWPLSYAAGK